MALATGTPAPSFQLESSEGGNVSSKELAGKIVVLYFYPRDNTPGCTVEAQEFRDLLPQFRAAGAEVFGVSRDSIASHCKFRDKFGLTFPLLSDPDGAAMTAFGAWGDKVMYGKKVTGVIRSTVVIDQQGKVSRHFPKVVVKGHAAKVLEHVQSLAGGGAREGGNGKASAKAPAKTDAKEENGPAKGKKAQKSMPAQQPAPAPKASKPAATPVAKAPVKAVAKAPAKPVAKAPAKKPAGGLVKAATKLVKKIAATIRAAATPARKPVAKKPIKKPIKTVKPPAKPVKPAKPPAKPVKPAKPPAKPVKPAKPPAKPVKLAKPVKPAKPPAKSIKAPAAKRR
jgi:thioredoxin-dependent peroxiredoxin